MNAGQFHHALCELSEAADGAVFGSSANPSIHFDIDTAP